MDRFVNRENVKRYRKLASESTDSTERLQIMKLLADEESKFKSELSRRGDATAGPSHVAAAAENRVEFDREGHRSGG
jgi:hypothetical protein